MLTTHFFKRLTLALAALFLLIVAALFKQPHLYLMAATLFLIPVVAYLVGRLLTIGLTCERTAPNSCSEGQQIKVTLKITASGPLPKFYVRAADQLPRWLKAVGDLPPLVIQLLPGESSIVQYDLQTAKRGVYLLNAATITTTDPLGFYSFKRAVPCSTELVVYPKVLQVREVFSRGAGAWGREYQDEGRTHGNGLDFYGVREYRQGDELRRVHWRTTARTGKLAVMEYTHGVTSDVLLALDLEQSAYADEDDSPDGALESAIKITATVAAHLLEEGYGVNLLTPLTIDTPLLLQGAEDVPRMLEFLARANADYSVTLERVLDATRNQAEGGKMLIFVTPSTSPGLSDMLDQYRVLGTESYGFVLDATSFRRHAHMGFTPANLVTEPSLPLASTVQLVRRGDNLRAVIEGARYASR